METKMKNVLIVVFCVVGIASSAQAKSHRLIDDSLLDIGNSWTYDLYVGSDKESGQVSIEKGTGRSILTVRDISDAAGYDSVGVQTVDELPTGSETKLCAWTLTSEHLAEVLNVEAGHAKVVTNDNPYEILPVWIDETDDFVPVGNGGQYRSLAKSYDGIHDGNQQSFVKFLRNETVTVPAGTFRCVVVLLTEEWQENEEQSGQSERTIWFRPGIGIIKEDVSIWESQYSYAAEYTRELRATNVYCNNSGGITNHLHEINIDTARRYTDTGGQDNPKHEFEFAVGTDETVSCVGVRTPAGKDFMISREDLKKGNISTSHSSEDGSCWWEYNGVFDDESELNRYGDGTYTITVYYNDGSRERTTAIFGVPESGDSIEQPSQRPVVELSSLAQSGDLPVVFAWEQNHNPNTTSVNVYVEKEDDSMEPINIELPVESYESGPHILPAGIYNSKLSFDNNHIYQNRDDITVGVGKHSETYRKFEVLDDSAVDKTSQLEGRIHMLGNGASSLMIDTVPLPESPSGIDTGASSLMIDTVPLPESPSGIDTGVKGGDSTLMIDTVPLPDSPSGIDTGIKGGDSTLAIGTWPTPESPSAIDTGASVVDPFIMINIVPLDPGSSSLMIDTVPLPDSLSGIDSGMYGD